MKTARVVRSRTKLDIYHHNFIAKNNAHWRLSNLVLVLVNILNENALELCQLFLFHFFRVNFIPTKINIFASVELNRLL